ncbi:MAG: metal-dependent hydrolase [Minicystis sp.]
MSSFLGHTLAAFTVSQATRAPRQHRLWFLWLAVLASAPDIDYLVPALHLGALRYRISHSLVGALLLPALTSAVLCVFVRDAPLLRRMVVQTFLAGGSHLLLDLLVGVTPLPLFWPLWQERIRLPFGILPSAGGVSLSNPYLYRNTLIEMGVLAPISALLIRRSRLRPIHRVLLAATSAAFVTWSVLLAR